MQEDDKPKKVIDSAPKTGDGKTDDIADFLGGLDYDEEEDNDKNGAPAT